MRVKNELFGELFVGEISTFQVNNYLFPQNSIDACLPYMYMIKFPHKKTHIRLYTSHNISTCKPYTIHVSTFTFVHQLQSFLIFEWTTLLHIPTLKLKPWTFIEQWIPGPVVYMNMLSETNSAALEKCKNVNALWANIQKHGSHILCIRAGVYDCSIMYMYKKGWWLVTT